MKLKIPFYRQKTTYDCGPASLEMVLAFFGKFESQKKLEKMAHTSSKRGTHQGMIDLALKEKFFCYVNENSTISKIKSFIKKKLPVIVNFIEPSADDGHYAIVSGFKDDHIILNDPWNGKNFKMLIKEFEKRWYYYYEKHRYSKWLMVLSKDDFNLGKEYKPKKQR